MRATNLISPSEDPPTGREVFAVVSVAVLLSVVYLWRLLPGLGFAGDTIKFQFVGPTAGTVHATGYPVYLMLVWLTSHVPIGEIAVRVNATSSLFAVVASVLIFFVLRCLGVRVSTAAAFAIGLGLMPVVLVYAVVAEVYTLHLALMMAMLLVLLIWERERKDRLLFVLMALVAVSFGNHMTTALLVPGILAFLWHVDRKRAFTAKMAFAAAGSALAAMLLYGYVVWRAADDSTFYVQIAPRSLRDLVDIWLGGKFRGRVFGLSVSEIVTDRVPLIAVVVGITVVVLAPLVVFGYRALRGSAVLTLLVWWFGFVFVFALTYDISDIPPYLIPGLAVLVILSAVGAERIGERWVENRTIGAALLVLLVVAMSVPILSWSLTNWSKDREYRTEMVTWLTELPEDSVLAVTYREAMAAWNLISIGGVETAVDVLFVEEPTVDGDHPRVLDSYMRGNPGYSRWLRTVISPGKTVYAPTDWWMCYLVEEGFTLVPVGPDLYRVDSVRYEEPIEDRWTVEMRDTCVVIDSDYADL